MPLYNDEQVVPPITPGAPTDTMPVYIDTASNYSNLQYKDNIIAYLDGTPWQVTYYAQYLGEDDVVVNSNDIDDPTLRQYLKINQFELRVTSALSNTFNIATNTNIIIGESNVYPVITPTVGDVFIGMIQDGAFGIFEVTSITRYSMFKQSAWAISYSQINFSTPDRVAVYDSYVVNELTFDVSKLDSGSNPLFTTSEYYQLNQKQDIILNLVEQYFIDYFDYVTNTFIVPNDGSYTGKLYDPFIVEFWNKFIDRDLYPKYKSPTAYNIKNNISNSPFITIFDILEQQSITQLKNCVKYMSNTPVGEFNATFQRHTVVVSHIDYVVYPDDSDVDLDNTDIPSLYLFSNNFYNNVTGSQTSLELQVIKAISKQVIAFSDIQPLLTSLDSATPVNKFYQTPIIIALLLLAR